MLPSALPNKFRRFKHHETADVSVVSAPRPSLKLASYLSKAGPALAQGGKPKQIERFLRANATSLKPMLQEMGVPEWDAQALTATVQQTVSTAGSLSESDPIGATMLARFAGALEAALVKPQPAPPPVPVTRLGWCPVHRAGPATGSHTKDMAASLTVDAATAGLYHDLTTDDDKPKLEEAHHRRSQMTAAEGELYAMHAKDVNCVLYTGPCLDLAEALRKLRRVPLKTLKKNGFGGPAKVHTFKSIRKFKFQSNAMADADFGEAAQTWRQ
jgi:hypothetical protein